MFCMTYISDIKHSLAHIRPFQGPVVQFPGLTVNPGQVTSLRWRFCDIYTSPGYDGEKPARVDLVVSRV